MEVFGKVVVKKAKALRQVAMWDGEENLRTLTVEELDKREDTRRNFRI